MPARSLDRHPVHRVWGRAQLPGPFAGCVNGTGPIGEIWFRNGAVRPGELLVKYLFTSERLSIQVHPDDEAAHARGLRCGKDEAWLVLDAEPGAVIGLGLVRPVSSADLRAAAASGDIEQLVDWRPVRAGDLIYSPGGTIHAIGGGLTLIEIQQDLDVTYRLYDYGRPRELHLDDAVAVAEPGPYLAPGGGRVLGDGREAVASGCAFVVERWQGLSGVLRAPTLGPLTVIPLDSGAMLDGETLERGSVWVVEGTARLQGAGELLVAYPGDAVWESAISG